MPSTLHTQIGVDMLYFHAEVPPWGESGGGSPGLRFVGQQDDQQLQRSLVFVGLGIITELAQDRLILGGVDSDQMLAGDDPLAAASRSLVICGVAPVLPTSASERP